MIYPNNNITLLIDVLAQTNGKADQSVLLSYMEQIFPNEFRNSLKKVCRYHAMDALNTKFR